MAHKTVQDNAKSFKTGLVSIMMPAYNAEKYIVQSIDTVIAQSYSNWELIIVNDGSTDKTVDVIAAYATDPRIKIIHQENGGEASARNTALNNMQGEFVSFLDSDDLYMPNTLADRLEYLNNHPEYGVVVSDGIFMTDEGNTLGQLSDIRPRPDCSGDILEILVLSPGVVGPPIGLMMRRELVENLALRFDTTVGYGTDWDFWTRLARHTQFGYLNQVTHYYRIHETNMTRSSGRQKIINDWIYGRMKVFNSDWFDDLSVAARQRFFFNLLINLLADQPDKQESILKSHQFLRLPAGAQAQILRQLGVSYLQKQSNHDFAVMCISQATALNPDDKKSRWLMRSLHLGKMPTTAVLRLWQTIHNIDKQIRSIGQHKPKPVPSQLSLISD
jgi:glycosyltransferase involved in cell wall biosynthesis